MSELFADLPEQRAPQIILSDHHQLQPCRFCSGLGVLKRFFPARIICRACNGGGKELVRIDDA